MTILKDVQKLLTKEDKTVFQRNTQLGPLIDMPTRGEFSSALAHNLLLRKTVCQKDHEVWFLIEGKPLRYSLNEVILISSLYTGGVPSKDEIKAQEEKNELKNKYWPRKKRFLMSSDTKKAIDPSWLQYANDLKFFTQYPWGNVCYNQTLKYIKTDLVLKFNKKLSSFNFYGCPCIVQIWAFEAMPKLCEMMIKKLTLNKKNKNEPWWLHWREDCNDGFIDDPAKLLEEDVILCSAADSNERNDELRSSHIHLDLATISSLEVFPTSLTYKQIGTSTPKDWQTHSPMPTFSTPVGPLMHGVMPTASTPILESFMHYIDHRIGEHQTYMKSKLVNHKVVIVQKIEANNKAIMQKIESVMTMNKEACSGGVDVEFE
ncbi:hypothetical protein TIFTF001_030061 [Ficus carica]|uniref:DUF1985 domain-containing protein n=1 Tax=Ficus carica TaxID=3494 RepID=A0AA88IZ17_FICCA|nr:hypothetical protein TIFTF001_030061 [Ficus carica]